MSKRRNKNEGKWEIEQQQFNEGGTEVQTSDCLLRGQYILVTSSNFPIDPLHRFLGGTKIEHVDIHICVLAKNQSDTCKIAGGTKRGVQPKERVTMFKLFSWQLGLASRSASSYL